MADKVPIIKKCNVKIQIINFCSDIDTSVTSPTGVEARASSVNWEVTSHFQQEAQFYPEWAASGLLLSEDQETYNWR